jgi:hypothetical protein
MYYEDITIPGGDPKVFVVVREAVTSGRIRAAEGGDYRPGRRVISVNVEVVVLPEEAVAVVVREVVRRRVGEGERPDYAAAGQVVEVNVVRDAVVRIHPGRSLAAVAGA